VKLEIPAVDKRRPTMTANVEHGENKRSRGREIGEERRKEMEMDG